MTGLEVGSHQQAPTSAEPDLNRSSRHGSPWGHGFSCFGGDHLHRDERPWFGLAQTFFPFIELPHRQRPIVAERGDTLPALLLFKKQTAPLCPLFWHRCPIPAVCLTPPCHSKMQFTERSLILWRDEIC